MDPTIQLGRRLNPQNDSSPARSECWNPLANENESVVERHLLGLSAGIHWLPQMVLWLEHFRFEKEVE
jgi:hypothetical protein